MMSPLPLFPIITTHRSFACQQRLPRPAAGVSEGRARAPNGAVPCMPTQLIADAIDPASPTAHYFLNWYRILPAVVGSDDEEEVEAVLRERGLVRQKL
jgi:hypothetical protein